MSKQKVFGIGLSRTGTRSLCEALRILGYKTAHCTVEGGGFINPDRFADGEYDAAADITVAGQFEEFDRLYPGARFVLTLRDRDPWIDSMRRHFARLPENLRRLRTPRDPLAVVFHDAYGGVPPAEWDNLWWAGRWVYHTTRVGLHFANRKDALLILRLCNGEGWESLCGFLGEPVPDVPFPHKGAIQIEDFK
jgi:hypothetical protein